MQDLTFLWTSSILKIAGRSGLEASFRTPAITIPKSELFCIVALSFWLFWPNFSGVLSWLTSLTVVLRDLAGSSLETLLALGCWASFEPKLCEGDLAAVWVLASAIEVFSELFFPVFSCWHLALGGRPRFLGKFKVFRFSTSFSDFPSSGSCRYYHVKHDAIYFIIEFHTDYSLWSSSWESWTPPWKIM